MKKMIAGKMLAIGTAILATLFFMGSAAMAGDYPDKPIRMIYPFPAGSGGDISTRILADAASKVFGKPVKVSNVTGGRATIGAAKVARARKDGYEIGSLPIGPAVTQPIFSGKLPYKTDDFAPICQFTYLPIVLAAYADAPFKTTKELIEYAKAHPGQVKYAHPGLGTVPYMMMKALEKSAGIKMKGLPFKGLRPGVTAAVGGHVEIALSVAAGAVGFQKAGKLNILGVFAGERMKLMPDVPTMDEDGVKDYPMLWTGIFAPKGTPDPVLQTLEAGFSKAVKEKKFIDAMTKAKMPILYLDSKAFKAKIDKDIKYFKSYKTEKMKK
jgi:tripartite-type tricarboxylate transporter receptor subunit TctC